MDFVVYFSQEVVEIQVQQKELLFDLLTLKKMNAEKKVNGLSHLIKKAKSGMSKEDIVYVEQLVNEDEEA